MDQCLHLVAFDRRAALILADWHQGRWLFPVCGGRERVRAAFLGKQLAAARGVAGDIVGQWLGYIRTDFLSVDSLLVVRSRASCAGHGAATWTSPRSLRTSDAVLEYQRWALEKLLDSNDRIRVAGPFGHPDWPDAVYEWTETVAGRLHRNDVLAYRIASHAVVMKLPTSTGVYYFKGLTPPATREAELTIALSNVVPNVFARTHALSGGRHGETWWLTRECPGATLARTPSVASAATVAEACGRLQRAVPAEILARLTPASHERAGTWATELLGTLGSGPRIDRCCTVIHDASRDVTRAGMPEAWLPLDLDPTNVILGDGIVRFIDVGDSYVGSAPLAIATLARRYRHLTRAAAGAGPDRPIRDRYEAGLDVEGLDPALWRAFEVMSAVLEVRIGWTRMLRNIERGDLHAPVDLIGRRVAERLLRTVLEQIADG